MNWNLLNELIALRELILSSMLSFISLLTLALFERSELMRRLLPSPEKTAEEFVHALCSARHAAAHHMLGELGRRLFREGDLERLARRLQTMRGGIVAIRALDSCEGNGVASARVLLTTADGSERLVSFALERENALWKLSSPSALFLLPAEQALVR